jgi:hypothetical protein
MDGDVSAAFESYEECLSRAGADQAERWLIKDAEGVEEIRRLLEARGADGRDVDLGEALKVRGRPPWKLRALIQRMRADRITRAEVYSGGRRSAAEVISALARQYDVNQRMIKKALGDL